MVFRCGHNGLIRLNFKQTLDFYNSTVTETATGNTADVEWRKAEFVFDWENKEVRFYFHNADDDSETVPFYYENLGDADGLMIYNLKPGSTSYFKELVVSDEVPKSR
jgi:hypothetical protein